MKAGIVLADQVTTVSPHYAQEIQTPEFGCGLEGVLLENQTKLTGILNGVNDQLWDPATDPHLKANYDAHDLTGKEKCKRHLLKTMGLEDTNAPLFGLVSRLAEQKGIDLIAEAMDEFLEQDVRLIVLGSGDPAYEDYFQKLAKQYPDKVAVQIGFDEALAHQIEAGADFFLMPSRFEPCGLNQMYSLRYGTLPIVHDTGGLSDSVVDEPGKTQTGFKFRGYTLSEFQEALRRALVAYSDSQQLWTLRREAMKQKFSWDVSAAHYENVYRKALRVPI
jgi:starch synthase